MQPTKPAAQTLTAVISSHRSSALRFMRLTEVMQMTGLRKTTIYQLQSDGDFPQRVQITAHCVGWIESEVQAWLNQRVGSRQAATPVANRPSATRYVATAVS